MLWNNHRLALAALLTGLFLALGAGCSKYDTLERNMQYVSDDLVRQDARLAWEAATAAHERWRQAGGGREAGNAAFAAYQDAYLKYAVIYNELVDRQKGPISAYLRGVTDEAPPAPPGTAGTAPQKPAPSDAPASPPSGPKARELGDAAATGKTAAKAGRTRPAQGPDTAAPAEGERYVVASGDTVHLIAKRHGISDKSLLEANGLVDPNRLAAGQSLVIPAR